MKSRGSKFSRLIGHYLLMKSIRRNNRGIALFFVLLVMMLILSTTGASLFFGGLNLKTAANIITGRGATYTADAGIQHALVVIPVGTNFNPLLAGSVSGFPLVSGKPTLTGSLGGYSYAVVVENDTTVAGETVTTDNNRIVILTSTATGPSGSRSSVRAYISRSTGSWVPPGAVYVAGQPEYVVTDFNGTSFEIRGQDTNPGGAVGSGPASPIPGITTTRSGTTLEISGPSGSLSGTQYPQVTGSGSSPSVSTTLPALNVDVGRLAQDLINLGVEGVDKQTLAGGTYTSGVWGTSDSPKITHITGNTTLSGDLTGYGVLVLDGDVAIRGNFNFKGLVIARAGIDIKGGGDPGTATVWGALLVKESTTSAIPFIIGGNGRVCYGSQTVNTVQANWGGALPQPAKLMGWHELMN